MNKQMKNALAGILILLLAACGRFETAPVDVPEFTVTVNPTDVATAVPTKGLAPGKVSQYIGLNFPPLPDGLSENFAMMIQDSDDHSLSLVLDGENKMLWLSKMTHRDSSGNAYWEVKDILELSNLEAGLFLLPDGCFLNGKIDNEIFAAGKDGKTLLAWRANTTLDRFEVLPANGIECHSDKAVSLD